MELDNEIALVRLAQSGSIEAFELLVNRYERQVYRLVRAITTSDHDAEELLGAIFAKAYENLRGFTGEERLYTWLARIATNAALASLRQRNAFTWESFDEHVKSADAVSTPPNVQEWYPDPSCGYSKAELDAILSRALEDLDTPLRIIFALGDVEGFSLKEIARLLGLPVPVAKACQLRARLKLRGSLSIWFENLSISASEYSGQ